MIFVCLSLLQGIGEGKVSGNQQQPNGTVPQTPRTVSHHDNSVADTPPPCVCVCVCGMVCVPRQSGAPQRRAA